jgi:hypothetical protein
MTDFAVKPLEALSVAAVRLVKEFGVDAVASVYAEANKDAIFFSKHSDWANEDECQARPRL